MVVNHEVGHALGFGHAFCRRRGGLAPVMQQQSKALGGCLRNPWPLTWERTALARRFRTSVLPMPPGLVLGKRVATIEMGMTRGEVEARLGEPSGLERRGQSGSLLSFPRSRLRVLSVGNRVAGLVTRSAK